MVFCEIAEKLEGEILAECAGAEIERFYAGDFLSHVMANAPSGCGWLTIMNNINIAGVAVIAEIRAVIFCENVRPAENIIEKCREESIGVIATKLPIFECCCRLGTS